MLCIDCYVHWCFYYSTLLLIIIFYFVTDSITTWMRLKKEGQVHYILFIFYNIVTLVVPLWCQAFAGIISSFRCLSVCSLPASLCVCLSVSYLCLSVCHGNISTGQTKPCILNLWHIQILWYLRDEIYDHHCSYCI